MAQELAFIQLEIKNDKLLDLSNNEFPTNVYAWNNGNLNLENNTSTYFGFVESGSIDLFVGEKLFTIYEKMYFSINQAFKLFSNNESKGFIVERANYKGFFTMGGEIEAEGRYKYIDGCSDSLLIAPVLKGDPCLNLLHFPPNTTQTPHTHPSVRIGMIVSGSGQCILENEIIQLEVGKIFFINSNLLHSFNTQENNMNIVVYHPDSDFGPTDNNHPMINKTIINGVSASSLVNSK